MPKPKYAEPILNERQSTHGDYSLNARISQMLKRQVRAGIALREKDPTALKLTDPQLESLEMICLKMGRIIAGDADTKDHWDDIAGYAKLVAERSLEAKLQEDMPNIITNTKRVGEPKDKRPTANTATVLVGADK